MATITVPASDIEDLVNQNDLIIDSFEWSNPGGNVNFSIKVNADYVFDTDEFIDIEEYNDFKAMYTQNKLLLEESEDELRTVKNQLNALQSDYDEVSKQLNATAVTLDETRIKLETVQTKQDVKWSFWK